MAIIRGFIILIFASLLCSNAIAESKVKRFLKSLENGIKKELRQRIEPRQNNRAKKQGTPESGINYSLQRTISGQCSVFGGGEKLDDDPCNREYFCEANRCYHAYVWPSGAKTIVELGKNGVPKNINGSRLKVLRNDNHTCVESKQTKRTFCFLELKKRVVKQEPPQKKVEIQKPKPDQPDRTVKVEALPSEGVYYYSGGQRCGAELRFLQARVKITKWGEVNVLFAYRNIEEDGTPKGFLDSDFIEWETWSDGRKRPIKFALRDDPRKVLALGGFSEGGRILSARWFEANLNGNSKCDAIRLTRTHEPRKIYNDALRLVKLEKPKQSDAQALIALEKFRAPVHWLHRNPKGLRNKKYQFGEAYHGFWTRYLSNGESRINAGLNASLDKPKVVHDLINRIGALPFKWSRLRSEVYETQYRLIDRFAELRFQDDMRFEAFRDQNLYNGCERVAHGHGTTDLTELSRKFANPVRFWSEPVLKEFKLRIAECELQFPTRAASFRSVERQLSNKTSAIRKLHSNMTWLVRMAFTMKRLQPTFESLLETKGFDIPAEVLRARGIGDTLYERAFRVRVKELKANAEDDAKQIIKAHFAKKEYETLWPSKAKDECYDPLLSITGREVLAGLKPAFDFCVQQAEVYAQSSAMKEASIQAAKITALKPSYKSLNDTNWFAFDTSKLSRIPPSLHASVKSEYQTLVKSHYDKAVANTVKKVRILYGEVEPFTDEEARLLQMCWSGKWIPKTVEEVCLQEEKRFSPYREEVRCERALVSFRASESMLDEYIVIAGNEIKAMTFRQFACDAARKKPFLTATLVGGGLAFWSARKIEIRDNQKSVRFVIELEERALKDNRGFLHYMWEIASGENDERLKSMWHGRKVLKTTFKGAQYKTASRALACIYGFVTCQ